MRSDPTLRAAPASSVIDEPEAPESWLPPSDTLVGGKYQIEGVIDRGGMGVVIAARHVVLDQAVAIKILRPERVMGGDAAMRFLSEARLVAGLTSEHVARVLDVGETAAGLPYIVMERLIGHDLAAVLDERDHLPPQEAVDLLMQAIEAIAEAHGQGIVHRDIKPSNLFLTARADGSPMLKVLDFGIAKALIPESTHPKLGRVTRTGEILGSPSYMSPEQVRDSSSVDHLTDVWSLGCTLYELLTGRPPFDAETLSGLCAQVTADHPRSIRDIVVDVPPELEAVAFRCLEKSRSARFTNVAVLATALAPFASEEGRGLAARARRLLGEREPDATPRVEPPQGDDLADTLLYGAGSTRRDGSRLAKGDTPIDDRIAEVSASTAELNPDTPMGATTNVQGEGSKGTPLSHTSTRIWGYLAIAAVSAVIAWAYSRGSSSDAGPALRLDTAGRATSSPALASEPPAELPADAERRAIDAPPSPAVASAAATTNTHHGTRGRRESSGAPNDNRRTVAPARPPASSPAPSPSTPPQAEPSAAAPPALPGPLDERN